MSKIDINNEIVLMRHIVRQARLHIVRKLVRNIKVFESKKGDDKQKEKYKRKADKLEQELVAAKKLKDDEITKYSITEKRSLKEILADQKSDPETRVLARLANHKIILNRVAQFEKKFPNFEEHLGPGKRKLMKLKRKAGKQAKKEAKLMAEIEEKDEREEQDSQKEDNDDIDIEESKEEVEESLLEIKEDEEPESVEKIETSKRKVEISSSENKRIKTETKILPQTKKQAEIKSRKPKEGLNKLSGISPTNKEAAVKSFSRFLEEKEDVENAATSESTNKEITNESKIVLEKEVDSFFMTEDGGGEYLSVVVPQLDTTEDAEGAEGSGTIEPNSARSRNNRFFDKVDTRTERLPQNRNNREKSNFVRGDRFKERNESRGTNTRNNINPGTKTRDSASSDKSSNENMHPSWAAKKKQQEILKLGFQGKKIVFDDDS